MATRTITLPRDQLLPGWRAAVMVYRAARQAGRGHHAADAEAAAAFRKVVARHAGEGSRLPNRGTFKTAGAMTACSPPWTATPAR
jgi:hypothetical protein